MGRNWIRDVYSIVSTDKTTQIPHFYTFFLRRENFNSRLSYVLP